VGCDVLRILLIGDIVGHSGRHALYLELGNLIREFEVDFVVANGENAAGGFGLTGNIASALFSYGIDVITTGNHVWQNKDIFTIIDREKRLLRPLNFPAGAPGSGVGVYEKNGVRLAVLNAMGRVFMDNLDCPFRGLRRAVDTLRAEGVRLIVVDFHAEATSEKVAMGYWLDGTVSVLAGTHTHVQTSDARILPAGSAYITDLGMTGPVESVIGVIKERAIKKFVEGMPAKFEVADGPARINAALVDVDPETGTARSITAIDRKVESHGSRSDPQAENRRD
jgi:hypothetical protein